MPYMKTQLSNTYQGLGSFYSSCNTTRASETLSVCKQMCHACKRWNTLQHNYELKTSPTPEM